MASRLGKREVARQMKAGERQSRAVDLCMQGWSYRRIAAELGYAGPSGVKKAIEGAIAKVPSRAIDALRVEVDERSRLLLEQLMPVVMNKRTSREDRLQAIDRVIKIDKELRALHGLDAPTSVRFDFSKFTDDQLRAIVAGPAGSAEVAGGGGAEATSGEVETPPIEEGAGAREGA